MRAVSAEFRATMYRRRNFVNYADITLMDDPRPAYRTILHLTPADFRVGGNSITDDIVDGDAFTVGTALGKTITLAIDNESEFFSQYNFYGAQIVLYIGLQLDDDPPIDPPRVEKIRIGQFTVITPVSTGTVITMEAVDNMYKFDRPYSECTLSYPASLSEIISRACSDCGVANNTGTPARVGYSRVVTKRPEGDVTYRQVISYVAQILGVNAKINDMGSLIFVWYTDSLPEQYADGGNFRKVYTPQGKYGTGDNYDGGSFARTYKLDGSYATGDEFDGGRFTDIRTFHDLGSAKGVQVGTDEILITGVKVKNGDTEYHSPVTSGWDDYCITIEDNPLTEGQEQTIAQQLWANVFFYLPKFRTFSLSYVQDPTIESGDWVVVSDAKRNSFVTFCTSVQFTTGGYTNISCNAQSPAQQLSYYSSQSARATVSEQRILENTISDYDTAVQNMQVLSAQAGGNYFISIPQSDGSVISYISDKELSTWDDGSVKFAQGSRVWKMGGTGFWNTQNSGTTDAGTSWTYGITPDNNMVMNTIAVKGISFDWAHGGTLKLGGNGNGNGVLRVYNASNTEIGSITRNGLVINSGVINGPTIYVGGSSNQGVLIISDSSDNEIGRWDLSGIQVSKGTIKGPSIEVGGYGNEYGSIKVYDRNNNVIGKWDRSGIEISKGTITGPTISGGTIVGATITSDTGDTYYELEYNRITGYQDGWQVGFFDWWGNCNGHRSLGIGGDCLNIWTDYLYVGDAGGPVYEGRSQEVTIDGVTLSFHKGLFTWTNQ